MPRRLRRRRPIGGGSTAAARARWPAAAPLLPPPQPAAAPDAAAPQLASFRDVVALVAERREAMLHAHLLHSVHLVRFAPPVIELRPQADAPRDLASKLAALLTEATGTRWTIALSAAPGRADAGRAGRGGRCRAPLGRGRSSAGARDPGGLPRRAHRRGARRATDAYGLPAQAPLDSAAEPPEMPDFAPPDADSSDEMETDA